MPGKKTLTLGITVNLDNYENLRLEVAGEVESQEDADELAGFLDGMLARLGRGDEATAARVDAYRHRVFSTEKVAEPEPPAPMKEQTVLVPIEVEEEGPEEVASEPAPEPVPEKPAKPAPAPEPITPPTPVVAEPQAPEPAPEKPAAAAPAPITPPTPVVAEPPAPEPTPEKPAKPTAAPASKPTPAAGEAVCEECGAPVTKTQKQMSQLFLSKTLCKGCMDKLTHPQ